MKNITKLEKQILDSIEEGYKSHIGEEPQSGNEFWTEWLTGWSGIKGRKFNGVLSSLVRKGFITTDKKEETSKLTEKCINYINGVKKNG